MIEDPILGSTPLGSLGEFGLIGELQQMFADKLDPRVLKGIGDDAAVVKLNDKESLVISTDTLMEGVHFDRSYVPIKHLGYKSCMVNFSDIYAMNARLLAMLMNLSVSNRMSVEAVRELYAGVKYACEQEGVSLIGGDTTSSKSGMSITVTVFGIAQTDKIVYRSGAQLHDVLCVTGDLGAAYAGLQILEREKQVYKENPGIQPDLSEYSYIVERQLMPRSSAKFLRWFEERGVQPTSMIDISDGLASEVNHLAKSSGLGAMVLLNKLPIDYETTKAAESMEIAAGTFALYGGEDYELLFTVRPQDFEKIEPNPHITAIGYMTDASTGINLTSDSGAISPLDPLGFNHFAQ